MDLQMLLQSLSAPLESGESQPSGFPMLPNHAPSPTMPVQAPMVSPPPMLGQPSPVADTSMGTAAPAPTPAARLAPRKQDLLLGLAPLVLSMFTARKDPHAAAGLLQGLIRGNEIAARERTTAQERERERKLLAARFIQQAAIDAARFETPEEAARYLTFAGQFLPEIDPSLPKDHLLNIVPVPVDSMRRKQTESLKGLAAARLKSLESDPRWESKVGTPEFEDGISVEIPGLGPKTPRELRTFAGLQIFDRQSGQVVTPSFPGKPASKQYQSREMLVDGNVEVVGFDPDTNLYYRPGSNEPIRNVRPVPDRRPAPRDRPASSDERHIEMVLKRPELWLELSQLTRTRILPALVARGFQPPPRTVGRRQTSRPGDPVDAAVDGALEAPTEPTYRWPDNTTRAYPPPADAQPRPPRPPFANRRPQPPPPAPGMVRMRAPDGQIKDVPKAEEAHYKSLGATVVQ